MKDKTKKIWAYFYHYSGIKFIARKFIPSDKTTLPTGFIWLLGIYVAFFGVASSRYENRVDIIENRINAIFTQLSNQSIYKKALNRIPNAQNMWCPMKPEFLKPWTVFGSLLFKGKYDAGIELLKETLEDWKDSLESVDLKFAILDGIDFSDANLEKVSFFHSDLKKAKLMGANLKQAGFSLANLQGANFGGTNLEGAGFDNTNFKEAFFKDANLKGTHFVFGHPEKLCEAMTLYNAELSPPLKQTLEQNCPQVLQMHECDKIVKDHYELWHLKGESLSSVLKKYDLAAKKIDPSVMQAFFDYSHYQIMKLNPNDLIIPEIKNGKDEIKEESSNPNKK